MDRTSFLSPIQQHQSTEGLMEISFFTGNRKHSPPRKQQYQCTNGICVVFLSSTYNQQTCVNIK